MVLAIALALLMSGLGMGQEPEIRGPQAGKDAGPVWALSSEGVETFAGGRVHKLVEPVDAARLPVGEDVEGRRWIGIRLASDGAAALRVHFTEFRLPQGVRAYFYGLDDQDRVTRVLGPYRLSGPIHSGDFWTDPVPGSRAVVEVQWDGSALLGSLPLAIGAVAHQDQYVELPQATEAAEPTGTGVALFGGVEMTYEVINGLAISEGDIMLGRPEELVSAPVGSDKNPVRGAVVYTYVQARWPGGVVPYIIDTASYDAFELNKIQADIAHWNTQLAGSINLIPRTNQTNYLRFIRGSGCWSYIGMIGGQQQISIGSGCFSGQVIHEIGHALGLFHEQSRNDRDIKITINWANITPGKEYNFGKAGAAGQDINAYDYGSIMHYPAWAFSINGQPTITTIPPGIPIGQRTALSSLDVAAIRQVYGGVAQNVSVTVQSNPGALDLTVDGAMVPAPRTYQWTPGSVHALSAPDAQLAGTKHLFSSWNVGGARTISYTTPGAAATVLANYSTRHQVTAAVNPAGAGSVAFSSNSADGYWPAGSPLTLTANANTGYCFLSWAGTLASTNPVLALVVTKPYSLTANFGNGAVTVAPTSVNVPAAGGTANISVTASGGCGWKVTNSVTWIIASPAAGTGSGVVTLSIAANTGTGARTATVTINNSTVTVTQAGAVNPGCTVTTTLMYVIAPAAGGTYAVGVNAAAGCAWTVAESIPWVTATPTGGNGPGSFSVRVDPNVVAASRYNWITVNSVRILVYQAGKY